ncbi:MAG: hypothetical protein ABH842_02545 [Candidatus Micrarchaeota archaeon]
MKGYFSFLLVFVSLLLIFTTMANLSNKFDFSKALAIERSYALSMNVKEAIIESALQGAMEGFVKYDLSHDVRMCMHCKDNFCSYDRDHPNYCDDHLCSLCFRENEARLSAAGSSNMKISSLLNHEFDPDFSVSFSAPSISTILKLDPLAKNMFSLDYIKLNKIQLALDSIFISVNSTLPELVVSCH